MKLYNFLRYSSGRLVGMIKTRSRKRYKNKYVCRNVFSQDRVRNYWSTKNAQQKRLFLDLEFYIVLVCAKSSNVYQFVFNCVYNKHFNNYINILMDKITNNCLLHNFSSKWGFNEKTKTTINMLSSTSPNATLENMQLLQCSKPF